LYYFVDSEEIADAFRRYMGAIEFPVDGQMRGEAPWKDWMITTRLDLSSSWRIGWEAIKRHQSQLPSLGPLLELPEEEVRRLLVLQGTFYRAFSLVNGGRRLETDLFEGLR
jgi:hypothetical protein